MAATQRQLAEALFELLVDVDEDRHGSIVATFIKEIRSRGLLTDSNRFVQTFEDILRSRSGDTTLRVRVAHGMSIPGAETVIDSTLIAGARAERDGRVADASVSGRLERLRAHIRQIA